MRILHIVPGSGATFYCENCLRDDVLVTALRAMGHDAVMVPMYLPLFSDTESSGVPVFYGAVNVFLKERLPAWRRCPRVIQRLLDSPTVLAWAGRKAGSTRARGLEDMTLSMLRGEEGRQSAELDRLVTWLTSEGKPDVIHLSNALLLGLAHRIRKDVGVPVVCSLQDEDSWINTMDPRAIPAIRAAMAQGAKAVDVFVAVSRFYAGVMTEKLKLNPDQVTVIPIGIDPRDYAPGVRPVEPPAIGYLSRLCDSLGFGELVDAFIKLKADSRFRELKLRATGGQTSDDKPLLARTRARLARHGFGDDLDIRPSFTRAERIAFLQSVSVLSVPTRRPEAFGVYLLEAMACGVPVVQPSLGAFPELVEETGAGTLYDPTDPSALSDALAAMLLDDNRAQGFSDAGRHAVRNRFSVEQMAAETTRLYESL